MVPVIRDVAIGIGVFFAVWWIEFRVTVMLRNFRLFESIWIASGPITRVGKTRKSPVPMPELSARQLLPFYLPVSPLEFNAHTTRPGTRGSPTRQNSRQRRFPRLAPSAGTFGLGGPDKMLLNASHIVMVEPVTSGSTVASLINQANK